MCEHGCRTSHTEWYDGPNIRPKQLRDREVSWEGSHRSKLMSRRIPIPNRDGPSLSATPSNREQAAGAVVSNDHRAGQESAEAVVPGVTSRKTTPDGLTTRKGLNLAGRPASARGCSEAGTTIGGLVSEAMKPTGRATGQRPARQRKSDCVIPLGLSGTAGRGPACQLVWEPGGQSSRRPG